MTAKKFTFILGCLSLFLSVCAAGEMPFTARFQRAESWRVSSSGKMTASNQPEGVIRFSVKFPEKGDRWIYPALILRHPQESLAGAETLSFEIKAEYTDSKLHFVMLDPGGVRIPYALKEGEWQKVVIDLKKQKIDLGKLNLIKIGMNPVHNDFWFELRNFSITGEAAAQPPLSTALIVETRGAAGSVYTDGQPLRFGLKTALPCNYLVRDWKGAIVRRGSWPSAGKGELLLEKLPRGYYMLSLEPARGEAAGFRSFAVVADPGATGRNPDMFFAVDTAQSWLGRPDSRNEMFPGEGYEVISDLVRLGGFSIIRERLSWSEVERKRGTFDWKQYDRNADLLKERGVKISGMFHNAPDWARTASPKLPDDLPALYDFCKQLAVHFKGRMANWEFWNEQDIGFAPESAWDYAAAMKTAYLGFKAGDPEIPVAVGALCVFPIRPYARAMMANRLAEYFDIFNYHTYSNLTDYPSLVNGLRTILAENQVPDMPIYFTETGTNAEGGGRGRVPGRNLKAHDPEQEMMVAEFGPKSQIAMQSLGVARNFFFVLPPYNEGDGTKDWGLMRRDYTAKPGYVALAVQVRMLGGAKYLGELAAPAGVRAFLYAAPDGSQTVAFWSKSELDAGKHFQPGALKDWKNQTFTLPVKRGEYSLTDIFGASAAVTASPDGLPLQSTRFISYVSGLSGLKPATPARRTGKPGALQSAADKSIVFKTRLSRQFILSVGKDTVDFKNNDPAPFTLEIYNFSDTEKKGTVAIRGAAVAGMPPAVAVPPFGKAVLELTMTPPAAESGQIAVSGHFNGKDATPLVMNVFRGEIALENCTRTPLIRANDPESWRKNSSGKMKITYDPTEEAVRFDTEFPEGVDRWVYPEFVLQLPQESFAGVYGMEFEIKLPAQPSPRYSFLMLISGTADQGKAANHLNYIPATGNWEKRTVFFGNQQDPDKIKLFRLGMNPRTNRNSFLLRNINILYKK